MQNVLPLPFVIHNSFSLAITGNNKMAAMYTHLFAHGNDHLHMLWIREEGRGVRSDVVVHDWTDLCGRQNVGQL